MHTTTPLPHPVLDFGKFVRRCMQLLDPEYMVLLRHAPGVLNKSPELAPPCRIEGGDPPCATPAPCPQQAGAPLAQPLPYPDLAPALLDLAIAATAADPSAKGTQGRSPTIHQLPPLEGHAGPVLAQAAVAVSVDAVVVAVAAGAAGVAGASLAGYPIRARPEQHHGTLRMPGGTVAFSDIVAAPPARLP
eukprot:5563176-Amphidinium_carterae.2